MSAIKVPVDQQTGQHPGSSVDQQTGQRPDASVDLRSNLAGLTLANPIAVASGTFASGREFAQLRANQLAADGWPGQGGMPGTGARSNGDSAQAASTSQTDNTFTGEKSERPGSLTGRPGSAPDGFAPDPAPASSALLQGIGALFTKGVSFDPWPGNAGVRITETASGMLNSIGLMNPGVEGFCANDLAWLADCPVPVIVNVCGQKTIDYMAVIERLEDEPAVAGYELNISCPNVCCGGMAFGTDPDAAADVTGRCRSVTRRPLLVKLTPNITEVSEVARAVEAAGADGISLINTVAGMAIDIKARRPLFERKVAGLSGPAIKPIALWAVYRVAQAVQVPLVGLGGIRTAADVVEFMLAGASVVAIGTDNFTQPGHVFELADELRAWCAAEGVNDIKALVGALE